MPPMLQDEWTFLYRAVVLLLLSTIGGSALYSGIKIGRWIGDAYATLSGVSKGMEKMSDLLVVQNGRIGKVERNMIRLASHCEAIHERDPLGSSLLKEDEQ